jgi:hypothetical protein
VKLQSKITLVYEYSIWTLSAEKRKEEKIQDPPPPPYLSLDCSLVYIITAVQYKVGGFFFVFDGMG